MSGSKTKRKRVYIAGKMRGIPYYNFGAFDRARDWLRGQGCEPVSPADIDRDRRGFDPYQLPEDHDWNQEPNGWDFDDIMDDDLTELETCDAIFMLVGWERSNGGAHMEFGKAVELKLEILFEKDYLLETALEEAHRLTNIDRQHEYGHPSHDFARQARMWTAILWDKLAEGCEISAKEVGLCMVAVKISREMNRPKRDNIVDGMGYLNCVNMIKERDEFNIFIAPPRYIKDTTIGEFK